MVQRHEHVLRERKVNYKQLRAIVGETRKDRITNTLGKNSRGGNTGPNQGYFNM
jgi:hypothetical protein